MNTALLFQIQSFLIMTLMMIGVYLRKKRSVHIKMMATAIIWDIILILQIELTRSAIDKASKALSNPMMLNIHISLALSSVVLYIAMITTGRKILKGKESLRRLHRFLGWTTLATRILVFVTSFWAVVK